MLYRRHTKDFRLPEVPNFRSTDLRFVGNPHVRPPFLRRGIFRDREVTVTGRHFPRFCDRSYLHSALLSGSMLSCRLSGKRAGLSVGGYSDIIRKRIASKASQCRTPAHIRVRSSLRASCIFALLSPSLPSFLFSPSLLFSFPRPCLGLSLPLFPTVCRYPAVVRAFTPSAVEPLGMKTGPIRCPRKPTHRLSTRLLSQPPRCACARHQASMPPSCRAQPRWNLTHDRL